MTEPRPYRQRDPRIPLNVAVSRADDVEPGLYLAVDLSISGICLRSTREEKAGGFVALSFTLDGHDLHLYAEVVWSRPDPTEPAAPYVMGLKWVAPSTSATRVIRAWIDRHLETRLVREGG